MISEKNNNKKKFTSEKLVHILHNKENKKMDVILFTTRFVEYCTRVNWMALLENKELNSSFSNTMENQFQLNPLISVESLQGKPRITEAAFRSLLPSSALK